MQTAGAVPLLIPFWSPALQWNVSGMRRYGQVKNYEHGMDLRPYCLSGLLQYSC